MSRPLARFLTNPSAHARRRPTGQREPICDPDSDYMATNPLHLTDEDLEQFRAAQSEADRGRLCDLGLDKSRVRVMGDVKLDAPAAALKPPDWLETVARDGDFVFAHTEYDFATSRVGFEVFRFEDDLAVEHWDNIQ